MIGLSWLQMFDLNPALSPPRPGDESPLHNNVLRSAREDQVETHNHAGTDLRATLNMAAAHRQVHDPAWPLPLLLREIQDTLKRRAARGRNVERGRVHGRNLRQ